MIIFGCDYACTPDQGVTAASCPAMMERTNFLTFHPPCTNEIYAHTHAQQSSCVTYWTKTKGLHTLESEVGIWQWYVGREMGQHALRFNKEEVMRLSPACSPGRPGSCLALQQGHYPGTLERSIGVCLFSCNKCDTGPHRNTHCLNLDQEKKKKPMKATSLFIHYELMSFSL